MACKLCTFLLATIAAMTFSTSLLFAQVHSSVAKGDEVSAFPSWKFGTEIDVLPYVMSGYYVSAFVARDAWRLRGVAARSDAPSFLVTDGFEKKRTDAYALLVDRFVGRKRNSLQGLWIGGGAELWRSRIRQDGATDFAHYNNTVVTAGGGYAWKLSNHFYVNPWSAMHAVVGGDRRINLSGKIYEQPRFTPELSVKFGIVF
jgi:hypothetical protein